MLKRSKVAKMNKRYFGMYEGLFNEEIRDKELKVNIETSIGLEEIIKSYEIFLENEFGTYPINRIEKINYTKKDIEYFCYELKEYENHKNFDYSGAYISALINNIIEDEDEVVLDLSGLKKAINYIGYQLKRGQVIVLGNIGLCTGMIMDGGKIIVKGNVDSVRNINFGNVVVEGDVGNVGYRMKGGEIIINGNAGYVGGSMTGGKIYLNGGYGEISKQIFGGEIYHKGKLILPEKKIIKY